MASSDRDAARETGRPKQPSPRAGGRRRRRGEQNAPPSSAAQRPEQVALALLAGTTLVSPILLGGVPSWATVTICVLAAITCWSVLFATRNAAPAAASGALAVVAFAALWTGVQALPLPCWLVEALSPRATAVHAGARELLGGSVTCTISIDPGATREALLTGCAVACASSAAVMLAAAGRRRLVLKMVVASALTIAVLALGHLATDATDVFGLYRPAYAPSARYGPILNPNNLAGVMVLVTPLLITAAVQTENVRDRVLWWLGLAVVVAVGVLTLSRAGIAAIAGGAALTAVAMQRRGESTGSGRARGAGVVAALAVGGGLYAALPRFVEEIVTPDLRKLDLVSEALSFAILAPSVGVGRGAFSSAFANSAGTYRRWTHAENLPAQWIAEWGLVFAVVAMATLGFALVRVVWRSKSHQRRAAAIGLLALAVHNLLDFGLELSGIATLAAVCLGAALPPERIETRPATVGATGRRAHLSSWRLGIGSVILATAALVLLGPHVLRDDAERAREDLTAALVERDAAEFARRLPRAVALHPAEPLFPLLAGAEASSRRDARAIEWLNRAMELAPGWAAPHVEAARFLARLNRVDQALLELREAGERQPDAATPLLCALIRASRDSSYAVRAAPREGPNRPPMLEAASRCLPLEAPGAADFDEAIVREFPRLMHPRLRLAARRAASGDSEAALRILEAVAADHPATLEPLLARAQVLSASEGPATAAAVLRDAGSRFGPTRALLEARAGYQASAQDVEGMRATIAELRGIEGGSQRALARIEILRAGLERRAGEDVEALRALQLAYRYDPDPTTQERIQRLSELLRAGPRPERTPLREPSAVPAQRTAADSPEG